MGRFCHFFLKTTESFESVSVQRRRHLDPNKQQRKYPLEHRAEIRNVSEKTLVWWNAVIMTRSLEAVGGLTCMISWRYVSFCAAGSCGRPLVCRLLFICLILFTLEDCSYCCSIYRKGRVHPRESCFYISLTEEILPNPSGLLCIREMDVITSSTQFLPPVYCFSTGTSYVRNNARASNTLFHCFYPLETTNSKQRL